MAYEIVPYAPAYAAQIAQLQTHLWSSDPAFNAAYLRWKYIDNPYLDEVLIRIALHDGQPVAMRGLFGALWEADNAMRQVLPYADDFVVVPEHRNRGPAGLVMRASLEAGTQRGLPFAVSLSAGPVTYISSLAAGWRAVGDFQPVWRVANPSRWARRIDRVMSTFVTPGLFDRLDQAGGRGGPRVTVSTEPSPQAMAELVARLPCDGRIRHVRDETYLRWRFRNPMNEYRFLFWDEGGLQGYLVLQRSVSDRADRTSINVSDWEGVDERILAGLLNAALEWGHFARVQVWTTGASESRCAMLRVHSFAPIAADGVRARSSGLLVRHLGESRVAEPWLLGRRNLLDIADWDLRMLYSMAG